MKAPLLALVFASVLLSACSGSSNSDPSASQLTEDLLPATLELQATRLKAFQGINQFSSNTSSNSVRMLAHAENMLTLMTDNRQTVIDTLVAIATQPFAITSTETISQTTADLTTPPFVIPLTGLSTDFLLLSSSSRFLTPRNTIKTRFKTPDELSAAWLRAVEFSNQRCVYVALQSVDANGIATAASNTLVVPLPAAADGECGVQI